MIMVVKIITMIMEVFYLFIQVFTEAETENIHYEKRNSLSLDHRLEDDGHDDDNNFLKYVCYFS